MGDSGDEEEDLFELSKQKSAKVKKSKGKGKRAKSPTSLGRMSPVKKTKKRGPTFKWNLDLRRFFVDTITEVTLTNKLNFSDGAGFKKQQWTAFGDCQLR